MPYALKVSLWVKWTKKKANQVTKGLLSVKDYDTELDRSPLATTSPSHKPSKNFWRSGTAFITDKETLNIQPSVYEAYSDIQDNNTPTDWALFVYVDQQQGPPELHARARGAAGEEEMMQQLRTDERGFVYLRKKSGDEISVTTKFVFIAWVPERFNAKKRAEVSLHKGLMKGIVKNYAVELHVTEVNDLRDKLIKVK